MRSFFTYCEDLYKGKKSLHSTTGVQRKEQKEKMNVTENEAELSNKAGPGSIKLPTITSYRNNSNYQTLRMNEDALSATDYCYFMTLCFKRIEAKCSFFLAQWI